jgi:hypothetical protein
MTREEMYTLLEERDCIKHIIYKTSKEKTQSFPSYYFDFEQMMRLKLWNLTNEIWDKKNCRTAEDVDANICYVTFTLRRRAFDVYKDLFCKGQDKVLNKALELPYFNNNYNRLSHLDDENYAQFVNDMDYFAIHNFKIEQFSKGVKEEFQAFLELTVERQTVIGKEMANSRTANEIAEIIGLSPDHTKRLMNRISADFKQHYFNPLKSIKPERN